MLPSLSSLRGELLIFILRTGRFRFCEGFMTYKARNKKLKHIAYIMLFTAIMAAGWHTLFSTSKQVHADNGVSDEITKERLDKFYEDSISAQMAGQKEAVNFIKKHLHKDLEGVVHVNSRIDGGPVQKETIVLTKFEYMRDLKKAYEISTIEEIKSGVVSHDIEQDGRSAKVKDRTYTMASVSLATEQGKPQLYHLRQFIDCDNLYVLSENDVLQLKSSSCEVEGQFNKAQEL